METSNRTNLPSLHLKSVILMVSILLNIVLLIKCLVITFFSASLISSITGTAGIQISLYGPGFDFGLTLDFPEPFTDWIFAVK